MQLSSSPPAGRLGAPVVLLRALLLAAVILSCAAFSHVIADGLLPSTSSLGWLLLGTAVVVRWFLHHPASRMRLLALVVGGQAVLHAFLSVMAGHGVSQTAAGPTVATPTGAGSLLDQYAARQDAIAAASGHTAIDPSAVLLHQWEHLVGTSPLMVLTHTLAAVVVALWLASGERALATLLALSADRVDAASPRQAVALLVFAATITTALRRFPAALRRTAALRVARPHPAFVHRVVSHRGPPALLAPSTPLPAR
ncbi:hypothetical protein [Nocardioides alcanivorans]|uniref:hypothetical protein n=1 Tax=Nocardioides alcanivorans TaxID=2897352 RepID=UPI001F36DD76|nr:hypothetical protein [Nocardioides alcanivorans]